MTFSLLVLWPVGAHILGASALIGWVTTMGLERFLISHWDGNTVERLLITLLASWNAIICTDQEGPAAAPLSEGAHEEPIKHTAAGDLLPLHHREPADLLAYAVTKWHSSCTEADRKRLQRKADNAQKIIGCPLSSVNSICNPRCLSRARNILKDTTHPGFSLFNLLPSGRRFRSIHARTNRLRDSFFPKAVTILNSNCTNARRH